MGNATEDATDKGITALLLELEHASHNGALTDALLLAALLVALSASLCRWPKLTGTIGVAWLAWFGFRFAEGNSAWAEVALHAQDARRATETAAGAMATMLGSWCVLIAPALLDLKRLLTPAAVGMWGAALQLWNASSWNERGIAVLFFLVVCSSVVATKALWRNQDTVKHVAFQVSFAVLGPLIWFLTSHLPHEYAALLVTAAMSLVPCLASVLALMRAQGERETPIKKAEPEAEGNTSWFAVLNSIETPMNEAMSEDLQAKMRMWLSYWSLWPFFHVAYTLVNTFRVREENRPAIDGIFVALILWAQFWEASRVAPYGFALCSVCFQGLSQRASRVADAAGSRAVGHAASLYGMLAERFGTSSPLLYVAAALSVIVAISFVLQVVELTEALVTLVFLFCVAFDSARCVARSSVDVYTARLAFWIIAMVWLKLREIPFLGAALTVWTPLVLVAALAAGETVLSGVVYLGSSLLSRCRRQPAAAPSSELPNAKYQEVSIGSGDEGQMLDRAPLTQAVDGQGGV